MPDAHLGQSMPIGGVIACDNVIMPDAVGMDCGCGMGAIKTSIQKEQIEDEDLRKEILHSLSRGIPVGFNHNTQKRINDLKKIYEEKVDYLIEKSGVLEVSDNPIGNIGKTIIEQLGTAGGGNHFIEIQYDEGDNVWIMLHSGSRNIGKKVADHFNAIATNLAKQWYSKCNEIPFLPADSVEGKAYLAWMDLALRFAYLNRKVMLEEVKKTFEYTFPGVKFVTEEALDVTLPDGLINIHHNFASLENQFGHNYIVHRKGSTQARNGQIGIIPGSMGTSSYIVKGLGNKRSMMSCSHGAGRKMGRRAFCRKMKYSHDQIEKSLEGVVHSDFGKFDRGKDKGLLDCSEAPAAYKDINWVMEQQVDLVEPIVKLKPLICMKG